MMQFLGRPAVGQKAALHFRQPEIRILGADDDVAAQCQSKAAADRTAGQGNDNRLVKAEELWQAAKATGP